MQKENKSSCFNSETIWNDIEVVLIRICKYLGKNKLGLMIKEIIDSQGDGMKINYRNMSIQDKFQDVHHIIELALQENKSEEVNSFFVEYFRLCALYFYSINEITKALDLLDYFIIKVNENLQGIEEEYHDKNLLIERDRMLINKAQILFWENRIFEANEIINNRINYLNEGLADEYYIIKMTYFYSTLLTYKAWIYIFESEDVEADKCFYLSMKLIKELKHALETNFSVPDLVVLHRKQINLYDQYLNFCIFRERKDLASPEKLLNYSTKNKGNHKVTYEEAKELKKFYGQPLNYLLSEEICESTDLTSSAFKFLKEILKILHKEASKNSGFFNYEIPEVCMIYYNILAAYYCISTYQNDEINIENCIYYLIQAYIVNNKLSMKFSNKFNTGILSKIIVLESLIYKYGKKINVNKFTEEEIEQINNCIIIFKHLIVIYEDENISTSNELNIQFNFDFFLNIDYTKNQAEANISKFSTDNKKKTINETINEIFAIKYLIQKFNYITANNIIQDKKLGLDQSSIVIEGLNGFLYVQPHCLTLIVQNTINKNVDEVFGMGKAKVYNKDDNYNIFKEVVKVKSSENYFLYYTKYVFQVIKENRLDIYGYLVMINFFDAMELYKPAILILANLLKEIVANTTIYDVRESYYNHFQLYVFFTFMTVNYFFKLKDYDIAFNYLYEISSNLTEYNWTLYYILMGVVLSKKKYLDLSAVYFEKALNVFSGIISHIADQESNEIQKISTDANNDANKLEVDVHEVVIKNIIKDELISENFVVPIKILISIVNMMKLKVITDFIKVIDLDAEKKLFENEKLAEEGNLYKFNVNKEKPYYETIINHKACFKCNSFELKMNEDKGSPCMEFNCIKCRRAFYCSYNCMKKDKHIHSSICNMYFKNFEKVNNLIKSYVLHEK